MKRERILHPATDIIAFLKSLKPAVRLRAIERLGIEERDALDRDWPSWAHDGQCPPPSAEDWRTWVILAGRGFGKTLAGAQWITTAVEAARRADDPLLIALVGATLDDARRVMIEGKSGLLSVAAPHIVGWWPSRRLLKFTGGSQAVLFSGASPEALRGPEHHLAWCDELAKWERAAECWDMLQLGLRLGDRPRALVTTTPRPGPVLRRIIDDPDTILTGGPTRANPHTPKAFKQAVERLYANTRLGAQELEGKVLTDSPGALWTVELLERSRIPFPLREGRSRPKGSIDALASMESRRRVGMGASEASRCFTRIVIGVDPPSGDGTCGIIACALDGEGIGHVLADHSVTACSPERWARAVADAAAMHDNPLILAERNQGGNMVRSVLLVADPQLRIKLVTAVQGKTARAEPVAMLFEAGTIRLHGTFPALESQLLGMIAGGEYEGPGHSPDRADAMIWALTELMLKPNRVPRLHQF